MNKIFNIFIKILFSFFGIGYIPKVSEIFAGILTLLLVSQLPEENRAEYILVIILIIFLTFILFFNKFFENPSTKSIIVINKVAGISITMFSPIIVYTYEWLALSFVMFFVFFYIKIFDSWIIRIKSKWFKFIIKDIFSGCLSLLCLNLIYTGYNLYPLIKLYLIK